MRTCRVCKCFVCLSFFLFVDVVLCKTVVTNCLLKAEVFCWGGYCWFAVNCYDDVRR